MTADRSESHVPKSQAADWSPRTGQAPNAKHASSVPIRACLKNRLCLFNVPDEVFNLLPLRPPCGPVSGILSDRTLLTRRWLGRGAFRFPGICLASKRQAVPQRADQQAGCHVGLPVGALLRSGGRGSGIQTFVDDKRHNGRTPASFPETEMPPPVSQKKEARQRGGLSGLLNKSGRGEPDF